MNTSQMSMIEVAEYLMSQKRKPQKFMTLAKEVAEMKGFNAEDNLEVIAQFYTDIILSSKFVYRGDETFDLKNRQIIDLYDKDSAYFNEGLDEVEELVKKRDARPKKEIIIEEPKIEQRRIILPIFDDEEDDRKYIDDIFNDEEETETDEYVEDIEDEEDDYNEIMDDYEDMYDEE